MMTYAEFMNLPAEKQKVVLEEMRREHGVGNLVKIWGISTSRLYKLIHELNLSVSKRGRKAKNSKKTSLPPARQPKDNLLFSKLDNSQAPGSKMTFTITAEGDGDILVKRLQPLFTAMSAANLTFKVSIFAEEI